MKIREMVFIRFYTTVKLGLKPALVISKLDTFRGRFTQENAGAIQKAGIIQERVLIATFRYFRKNHFNRF